ncbi:MAG: aconitate hydratase [Flavobacteriaceae bacterium]|nr:aconitate hydratase [Flavobacteriaceae bacterium]
MNSYLTSLKIEDKNYTIADLNQTAQTLGFENAHVLPKSLKVLFENLVRRFDGKTITESHLKAFFHKQTQTEIFYLPSRVLMQDFTGVPGVVDLAAMRDAITKKQKDPSLINPSCQVDLVIDHSIQVDKFASANALGLNEALEMQRNKERYELLKWGQAHFNNFRVVPPGAGICHQVNIEYLAPVVGERDGVLFPDTLVGTDSHTTMINALGVLGWGVGGIEAEAVMLGEPIQMVVPPVVGIELSEAQCQIIETYAKHQGFWHANDDQMSFTDVITINLSDVKPCLAGPKRPQDKVYLSDLKTSSLAIKPNTPNGPNLKHNDVVIAAITSCTNTSNPSILICAGLLAKAALARGLKTKPWVKTSFAPGSRVVTDYLEKLNLMPYLNELGFNLVGYGCTTCIGNSGPLSDDITKEIEDNGLAVSAVLSGNRNFEGRIHPQVKANWLASPPLVVAFAIAGTTDIDLTKEPLGQDANGVDVYLKDIWPSAQDIDQQEQQINQSMYAEQYKHILEGNQQWQNINVIDQPNFSWDQASTYVRCPDFFQTPEKLTDVHQARILLLLGDSVTTDHISPAGAIKLGSPAAQYLSEHNIEPKDFNTYGSRRGNHEIMQRGTFANIRIRNLMNPDKEGGYTTVYPEKKLMSVFDAAMHYQAQNTPLVVFGGKEYGTGSSRDWAAKGTYMLGVKVVICESFERIHRSNLVGMGVLPCQLNVPLSDLNLVGDELIDIDGISDMSGPKATLTLRITRHDGSTQTYPLACRIDTDHELEYYRSGGILAYMVNQISA